MDTTCRYWKRIERDRYEPHSHSIRDRAAVMDFRDALGCPEAWCGECEAVVESEGGLNAQGIYLMCPWCGERLNEAERVV